jgi:DNA-binding CsgD family transcriptional regulator
MPATSSEDFLKASARLGDAVVDPAGWPSVMEDICRAVGAAGAVLLQSDIRTPDVPRTDAVSELLGTYFREGWHTRDPRADRGTPLLNRGQPVVIDQDILSPDEMRREASYNECYIPSGFQWWAVIGFWSGAALWGFSIQRTPRQGPFHAEDKRILSQISHRLTEAATLSKAVSRSVLTGMTNALNLVRQPALAVDRRGFVLEINAAAEQMFSSEIHVRDRRLCVADKRADAELRRFMDQIRITADDQALPVAPMIVRRQDKAPVLIRILPIERAARSPFLGARALLMLQDLGERSAVPPPLLSRMFGLTAAEANLASLIGAGCSINRATEQLNISSHTARTQLKAIFAKAEIHRQADLVALLSQLRSAE